ncbi:MAG: DNA polymerase III subunit gamma/tau [Defluviitaleaceae bacterium]|nr:DNA polymerase III subunit gamma/tau [Defluviitaleaceae bacterium]
MARQVLYRRKRPLFFRDIAGQPHIVRALTNQIASGKAAHAYLFAGTKGTGKTTTARILARALCCESPDGGEPCNVCDSCKSILSESNLNVNEVDAATFTRVDDIRDLREEFKYLPSEGKYRVYIMDEAHMLSSSAFAALLKSLEEPPPHVVFMLATTDPHKIPATIISRCQRYDFKRIPADTIRKKLMDCANETECGADDDALGYIAAVSDGSLRDAFGIFDQCLIYYEGERITLSKTLFILSAVDAEIVADFSESLLSGDSMRALSIIDIISKDGRDYTFFATETIKYMRDMLVAKQAAGGDLIRRTETLASRLNEYAVQTDAETLIMQIREFSELLNELRYSPQPKLALEVRALKLCNPQASRNADAIFARLDLLEKTVKELAEATEPDSVKAARKKTEGIPQDREKTGPTAFDKFKNETKAMETAASYIPDRTGAETQAMEPVEPDEAKPAAREKPRQSSDASALDSDAMKAIVDGWKKFIARLGEPMLTSFIEVCELQETEGVLTLLCPSEAHFEFVSNKRQLIEKTLAETFGLDRAPNLAFKTGGGYNNRGDERKKAPAAKKPAQNITDGTRRELRHPDDYESFGTQIGFDAE